MGLKAQLKEMEKGFLAAVAFYALAGIVFFIFLANDFGLIHICLMGVLSLATSYGVFRKRVWALWSAFVLFFMVNAFALSMLYYAMSKNILLDLAVFLYLVLTWIFTVYIVSRKRKLRG
ncbi:MAG: hypothetical protein QXN87_01850 [Candidatus Bathyarchaeia archaeon]